MRIIPFLTALPFIYSALVPVWAAPVTPTLKKSLDTIYEGYDTQRKCWRYHAEEAGNFYCFKVDRVDNLSTDTGKRVYVLLTGNKYDASGENAAHADAGRVGALVFAEKTKTNLMVLAADPMVEVGAFGQAPTKWDWVKLGPSNYWGWKNAWSDGHQGFSGARYSILAPYGKGVKDLAGFVESYTNEGSCVDDKTCKITTYGTSLKIDTTQASSKVFPLNIRVTGKQESKTIPAKTWTLPFNTQSWRYEEPKDWPLKNLDF